jgi:Holliday junction DNA helicase RuvA
MIPLRPGGSCAAKRTVIPAAPEATSCTMITFLEGRLEDKQLARIVLNVGGVGYEVFVPLSSYDRLPAGGERCRILTYHHMTEADQRLFGFCTEEEREMFIRLLTISGIGPRLAISILSGLSVRELKAAIAASDIKRLSSISGIGKKTAERIVVELRDKFNVFTQIDAFMPDGPEDDGDTRLRDAALALAALGHKSDEAAKMIKGIAGKMTPASTVEDLIRMALTR